MLFKGKRVELIATASSVASSCWASSHGKLQNQFLGHMGVLSHLRDFYNRGKYEQAWVVGSPTVPAHENGLFVLAGELIQVSLHWKVHIPGDTTPGSSHLPSTQSSWDGSVICHQDNILQLSIMSPSFIIMKSWDFT